MTGEQRPVRVAAVDLGASSGRVMAVEVNSERVQLTEVHRFWNGPIRLGHTLHWDVLGLYRGVLDGLRNAGPVSSVGVDSWAVDYGLLDATGSLLGNPVHYRDSRTDGVAEKVHARIAASRLYETTGVQVLPFNTIYQLVAAAGTPQLQAARQLLLIPELIGYGLAGVRVAEKSNASTTGLLDVRSRSWSLEVLNAVGIDPELLPPLVEAGTDLGRLLPEVLATTEQDGPVRLIAVASHDTASAVAGVPAQRDEFAYVATGTWSLVGLELDAPVLTEAARAANFSNELGVDGTVRFLRNVMGLWLLQECLRAWGRPDLAPLLAAAAEEPALAAVVDAGDAAFLQPGDMPARIAAACAISGQKPPETRPATVRCILDSLALAHRRTVREAQSLSGRDVEVVHVVGGGARNELLCQLTADACGLPVVAGPVEAAAYANGLVQARAAGVLRGGLPELRALLTRSIDLVRYEPRCTESAWQAAEHSLRG